MTLKMTVQQANALFDLYNNHLLLENPATLEEKLVMLHMIAIYRKLRAKLEARAGNGYSVSLTDAESLAYWSFFEDRDLNDFTYERTFIMAQVKQIDQQVNAKFYTLRPTTAKLIGNG